MGHVWMGTWQGVLTFPLGLSQTGTWCNGDGSGGSGGQMRSLGTTGTESEDPEGALRGCWTPECG